MCARSFVSHCFWEINKAARRKPFNRARCVCVNHTLKLDVWWWGIARTAFMVLYKNVCVCVYSKTIVVAIAFKGEIALPVL